MNEALGDKSRDELTHHLSALGIDAVMAERGQVQEKIMSGRCPTVTCVVPSIRHLPLCGNTTTL
jgi:hypothetical protein